MKTKTTIIQKFLIHCLSLLLILCSVTVLFPTSASAITTDTYSTISNIGTGKVLNVHGNGNADALVSHYGMMMEQLAYTGNL